LEELRKARLEHGPMMNLVLENKCMRDSVWWDSEAFADALARADREAPDKATVFDWNASLGRRSLPVKLQAAFYNWFAGVGSLASAAEILASRVERLTEGNASERPLLLRKL
jgi:hypothetical protein